MWPRTEHFHRNGGSPITDMQNVQKCVFLKENDVQERIYIRVKSEAMDSIPSASGP